MARILREASLLKRALIGTQVVRAGILGTSSQLCLFSSKASKKPKPNSLAANKDRKLSKKEIALNQALEQITSSFGSGAIMWLGRSASIKDVPVISTGSLILDVALGVGGLPKGRVVEIFGPEASGKTTLALHVIAEAQKQGGCCVFIDAEHALDPSLARAIGVKTEKVLLSQPDCGEQALSLVDTLIRSGSVDVIVVDSVAALVPKGELEGEMGDAHVAMQARLMSQALRKLSHSLSQSQTLLIFINQVRSNITTFGYGGPTEVTCGGNALKFYASVRLNIKRIGFVKKAEAILGSVVQVKVVKNKLAPPFKVAQFELEFGHGISQEAELIDLAVKYKLASKNSAFYNLDDKVYHGKDALKKYLKANTGAREILASQIRKKLRSEIKEEFTEETSPPEITAPADPATESSDASDESSSDASAES